MCIDLHLQVPALCLLWTYLAVSYIVAVPICRYFYRFLDGDDAIGFAAMAWLFAPIVMPITLVAWVAAAFFRLLFWGVK